MYLFIRFITHPFHEQAQGGSQQLLDKLVNIYLFITFFNHARQVTVNPHFTERITNHVTCPIIFIFELSHVPAGPDSVPFSHCTVPINSHKHAHVYRLLNVRKQKNGCYM